jgi:hypothetical protein
MKNLILSICLIMTVINQATSQAPVIDWQKSYGGSGDEYARSITPTSDGGYIMAGSSTSFDGEVTGHHATGGLLHPQDFWVVKVNSTGTIEWQKSLGGGDADGAVSIIQTTDGGYIVAGNSESVDGDRATGNHGSNYDYWVVKLSSTGSIQWQKSLGGLVFDYGYSIIQTTDGGYIIAGDSNSGNGDLAVNYGGYDIWVVKLSSTGSIQWQKNFGGNSSDHASQIIQTTDGGYMMAGFTDSNNIDVVGNHGLTDIWLVKINSTGGIQWQKTFGGTNNDYVNAIIQSSDGGYAFTGNSTSTDGDLAVNNGLFDFWVVKISNTGAIQWQRSLGGSYADYSFSIIQSNDGNFVIAGQTDSINGDVIGNHGGTDAWVVKLSSSGVLLWQKTFGGTGRESASQISQTSDGGLILAGLNTSNNGDVTGNHGNSDFWVAKLSVVPFSISPNKLFAICQPTATITAAGCSGTVNWYRDVNGSGANNQFLSSGNTLTYSTVADWRQYIRATCTVGGIASPYSNYSTVQTGPEVTPLQDIVSPGSSITITASGCPAGTTYLWGTGETSQTITKTPTISPLTLYYVKCTSNTCQSADAYAYIYVSNIVANNDTYTTNLYTPISGNFCTNDQAFSPKSVLIDYPPTHGSVVWDNTGAFTYTPNVSYSGQDSFKYYMNNSMGSFSNYATVTINIVCPYSLPLSSTNSPSDDFSSGAVSRQASSY